MTKILTGKVALVTGGTRGIGAACARELARAGADVAISYVARADLAEALVEELRRGGVRAAAFKSDQSDAAQVSSLIETVVTEFGGLDVLIANAASMAFGPVFVEDVTSLDAMLNLNIFGTLNTIRAASKVIRDDGRIVVMSSDLTTRVGGPNLADYTASKAAVEGFVKGAAHDLAARRVTINALKIGAVNTDMNPEDGPAADYLRSLSALKRYADPKEIAAVVGFLASPASSYVTGGMIPVNGGNSA